MIGHFDKVWQPTVCGKGGREMDVELKTDVAQSSRSPHGYHSLLSFGRL